MRAEELAEALRSGFAHAERTARELASQGWAIAMSLTPAEMHDILAAGSPSAVDDAFVALYESNGRAHFESMASGLLDRDVLAPWQSLLQQILDAYRRGEFAITVPALLTVCEGVMGATSGNETNVKALVAKKVKAHQQKWADSFTALLWRTLQAFIEELFKKSDFTGARPDVLNRHWILHGRDASTWTQADSLRLIQALDTISNLYSLRAV